jgi:hypothetical protein
MNLSSDLLIIGINLCLQQKVKLRLSTCKQ